MLKNFAKIVNGVIVNIAVAEDAWPFPDDPYIECPDGFGIGDLYDGTNFSKAPPPVPTPTEVATIAQVTQNKADVQAAKADTKLAALSAMTPAQVRTWVATNITNLADAKDALATLAVCVSILARKL